MNRTISLFLLLGALFSAQAQSTLSPYTLFGIGEVNTGNHGEYNGMGGVGIGMSGKNILNTSNPAALSALDKQTFVFDASLFGCTAWNRGQGRKEMYGIGNFDRIALGFRASSLVSVSAGIVPLTNVGYSIRSISTTEGSDEQITNVYAGSGGLYKGYLSMGISIGRHLSAGVTAGIIGGSITHTETSDYWVSEKQMNSSAKPTADFGLQYYADLSKDVSLTIGAVAGLKTSYAMRVEQSLYRDTTIVKQTTLPTEDYCIPGHYGVGVSLSTPRWTFGADYSFQDWSGIESGSSVVRYKDMNKIALGVSYVPEPYSVRHYYQRIRYQAGISVDDSYLSVSNTSGLNLSCSCGVVLPLINRMSANIALTYSRRSFPIENRSSITENSFRLTIGISFRESWFMKSMFN